MDAMFDSLPQRSPTQPRASVGIVAASAQEVANESIPMSVNPTHQTTMVPHQSHPHDALGTNKYAKTYQKA